MQRTTAIPAGNPASPSTTRAGVVRWAVGALVAAVATASCTGTNSDDPQAVVVTTTTEPPVPRIDDGVLRIGALVPAGDTAVGAALSEELDAAVAAVNDAGGVLGENVELVVRDEGTTALGASAAIEQLVGDDDVDAIVGPTSSNSALGALDDAIEAGIVTCSATASSIALDSFPDDGLFFRTIATDSLQAIAIANQAQATGATRITIVNVDDAYGRPYAAEVIEELEQTPLLTVDNVAVPVDDIDLADEVDEVVELAATTVIVIGSGADTGRFLEALAQRDDLVVDTVFVNDAARDAASRPVFAGLPTELRERIVGIAPQIVLPNPGNDADDDAEAAPNQPFRPQVVDCVNLISLAAVQSGSDSPGEIASQMASVASGGSMCDEFAECVAQLEQGLQINYDGPTGVTELGRNGDPSRARFDRFRFDTDGSAVFERQFTIER